MAILTVKNLSKSYPKFQLNNISFSLNEAHIIGFVGRNGAGKTTTIKSMLNLIHIDSGEVMYFDKNIKDGKLNVKCDIGYSTGTINWYPRKKIKEIVDVVSRFYETWNHQTYCKYLNMFKLDEEKMPIELSDGMKVKANLLIALSHNAKILILDEPTSGLDPFSRDELIELFKELKKQKVTIFFSTHIILDIEKCADDIIYISKGTIVSSLEKSKFIEQYGKENETLEEIFLRIERGNNDV